MSDSMTNEGNRKPNPESVEDKLDFTASDLPPRPASDPPSNDSSAELAQTSASPSSEDDTNSEPADPGATWFDKPVKTENPSSSIFQTLKRTNARQAWSTSVDPPEEESPPTSMEVEDLRLLLIRLELVNEEEWQEAINRAGDYPIAQTVLAELALMPSWWDAEEKILTEYQCVEILAGRAEDLRLDKYIIRGTIGEGGMGKVYRALQKDLGALHALKTIRRELFDFGSTVDTENVQWILKRFINEIHDLVRLDPQHVPQIHTCGEVNGVPYYAMEMIDGHSLDQIIDTRRKENDFVPIDELLDIFIEIARAVTKAHEREVVHRDLTPRNIMVTRSRVPKILDFGIAKHITNRQNDQQAKTGSALTSMGQQIGSRPYMSPEQHSGDIDKIGYHTDVYVLAATMYHVLTLAPPFPGNTATEIMAKHFAADRPSPSKIRKDVPARLDAVIQRALAVDIDKRYPTMTEFREALEGVRNWIDSQAYWKTFNRVAAGMLVAGVSLGVAGYFVARNLPKPAEVAQPAKPDVLPPTVVEPPPPPPPEWVVAQRSLPGLIDQRKYGEVIALSQKWLREDSELSAEEQEEFAKHWLMAASEQFVAGPTPERARELAQAAGSIQGLATQLQSQSDGSTKRIGEDLARRAKLEIEERIKNLTMSDSSVLLPLLSGSAGQAETLELARDRLVHFWSEASGSASNTTMDDVEKSLFALAKSLDETAQTLPHWSRLTQEFADLKINSLIAHAKKSAAGNPDEALESLGLVGEVRELAGSTGDSSPAPLMVGRLAESIKLARLSADAEPEEIYEQIPTVDRLKELEQTHQELGLASDSAPRVQMVRAIDALVGTLPEADRADNAQWVAYRTRAEDLGLLKECEAFRTEAENELFGRLARSIVDADTNLDQWDQEFREVSANKDLSPSSIKRLSFASAARRQRWDAARKSLEDAPISTDELKRLGWSGLLADLLLNEIGETSREWISSDKDPSKETLVSLGQSLSDIESLELSDPARQVLSEVRRAELAAISDDFVTAETTLTKASGLASENASLQKSVVDAVGPVVDRAVRIAEKRLESGESYVEIIAPAQRLADWRLSPEKVPHFDAASRALLKLRHDRMRYLEGRWRFRQKDFARADASFRDVPMADFEGIREYKLLAGAIAKGIVPINSIEEEATLVVPVEVVGQPEEHLLHALWEMCRFRPAVPSAKDQIHRSETVTAEVQAYFKNLAEDHPGNPQAIFDLVDGDTAEVMTNIRLIAARGEKFIEAADLESLREDVDLEGPGIVQDIVRIIDAMLSIRSDLKRLTSDEVSFRSATDLFLRAADTAISKVYGDQGAKKQLNKDGQALFEFFPDQPTNKIYQQIANRAYRLAETEASVSAFLQKDPRWLRYLCQYDLRVSHANKDWERAIWAASEYARTGGILSNTNSLARDQFLFVNACEHFSLDQDRFLDAMRKYTDSAKASPYLGQSELTEGVKEELGRQEAFALLIADLNGIKITEAELAHAVKTVEQSLETSMADSMWERPILLGIYKKHADRLNKDITDKIAEADKAGMPFVHGDDFKSFNDAVTRWGFKPYVVGDPTDADKAEPAPSS